MFYQFNSIETHLTIADVFFMTHTQQWVKQKSVDGTGILDQGETNYLLF